MSRAFKKEPDSDDIDDPTPEPLDALPTGATNDITPSGTARLKEERDRLIHEERARALDKAGTAGDPARRWRGVPLTLRPLSG